jgi:predicted dienelactone hydrolase/intracellular septation protein A
MKQALSNLLNDFLSAILFFAAYSLTGSIVAGTTIAIAIGVAQFVRLKLAGRAIEPMQWVALGLVVVLGTATLLTQSPRFMMLKPSFIHFAVAAVMLRRGWMSRYLPATVRTNVAEAVIIGADYAWAGLMVVLGATNLVIATQFDIRIWAWFISFGSIGAKVAAFLLQYAVFRTMIRRKLRSATGAAVRAAGSPSTLLGIAAGLILLASSGGAGAVAFQQAAAPDPQGQPLELDIWYPSDAPATSRPLGLFQQVVAADAPISGSQLPLIVISHGTGGAAETHYDTALALAEAGFIAVAVTHTGDNWRDRAVSFTARNFIERPRHIKLTIDYMLTAWSGGEHVAAARIGAFGHSAGGFTVLVAIGGNPELARLDAYCRDHPDDWGCQRARALARGPTGNPPAPAWAHDERIKAAVVAAPAAGHAFTAIGLAPVAAPVQLWEAEDDRITPNRWSAENVKANLPSPPELHLVPSADHFAFIAPCSTALAERVPDICQDPPGFDRTAFHRDFNAAVVGFFQKQLDSR